MAALQPMNDTQRNDATQRRPGRRAGTRRPWLVALGFLLAFAATVLTVIWTGLMLGR